MNKRELRGKENANMADNQVAFRKLNNKLKKLIDELDEVAKERGELAHAFKTDDTYHFYCECSDENCLSRITMSFDAYEQAHERDDTFTILRGHEVFDIEEVISVMPDYCVVRKFETPKQSNEVFHETALDNVT